MQICMPHWEKCKCAVQERGMWPLVAQSGKDAVDSAVAELEGRSEDVTWDPLMAMNWNFMARAMEQGGLYVMSVPPEGEGFVNETGERHYCPLCEVAKAFSEEEMTKGWINGCADAMLEYAREQGLVPKVQ